MRPCSSLPVDPLRHKYAYLTWVCHLLYLEPMRTLQVSATIRIERPATVVRRQFADVAHHAATGVHDGVTFVVCEQDADQCTYRQTTRLGPLKIDQQMALRLEPEGPLVNTITKGQFEGGSISFTITPEDGHASAVSAELNAPLNIWQSILAPVLRMNVRKALDRGLAEDKLDLESGSYPG